MKLKRLKLKLLKLKLWPVNSEAEAEAEELMAPPETSKDHSQALAGTQLHPSRQRAGLGGLFPLDHKRGKPHQVKVASEKPEHKDGCRCLSRKNVTN